MSVTREELAAFADGELDPVREAGVAAAVAADPKLAEQVRLHRALGERLAEHFAPMAHAPLPEHLTAPLQRQRGAIIDLSGARRDRQERKAIRLPRLSWFVGPALAASLALAVFLPGGGQDGYAQGALATALEQQLVSTQEQDAPHRVLLSFRNDSGTYCRAFVGQNLSGIACREAQGWRLYERGEGAAAQTTEYRMAGNSAVRVLERAQEMAAGPALGAEQERNARARGWR